MIIKILGQGPWGRALASLLQENKQQVSFLTREESSHDQDVLVLALPTQAMRTALTYISFLHKTPIIINTSKGIEQKTHYFPHQIAQSIFGKKIDYYALMGPSFATEVTAKMPTLVNLGYTHKNDHTEIIRKLFLTDFFRVKLTHGVEALELAAAFKNIYAIGCGVSTGLGYGSNTRTKLMVLAIDELQILSDALAIHRDSNATPETIGDIILTCSSIESRNFTFGKLLADHSVQESRTLIKSTVEGYHSLASVSFFEERAQIKLPLAHFIEEVVKADNPNEIKHRFDTFIKTL